MTVHFIGAGPGAADLVTVRGRALISRCQVCLHASGLVPEEILEYAPPGARVVDTAALSVAEAVEECRLAEERGQDVAWLQAGDFSAQACIEERRSLDQLGIAYTVTPGVPYVAAAMAAVGDGMILPEAPSIALMAAVGTSWTMPPTETLEALVGCRATLAVPLPARAVDAFVKALRPLQHDDCPAALIDGFAGREQRVTRGTLATIIDRADFSASDRMVMLVVGRAPARSELCDTPRPDAGRSRRHRGSGG